MLARLIEAAEDLRAAAGGADLRSASARILRAATPRRRGCRRCASKLEQFRALGVDAGLSSRASTRGSRRCTPDAFIDDVLVRRLGVRWVLVGDDFRFGKGRAGDLAMLRARARRRSASRRCARSPSTASARRRPRCARRWPRAISSAPRRCSGRPYAIGGRVAHGDKLGRSLGLSDGQHRAAAPARRCPGIFAVRVHGLGDAPRAGVASLGVRPTVKAGGEPLLEVFLFDFDEAIYGRRVTRRVPAQAARRGALRRPRRADAPDPRRRRAGARLFRERAPTRVRCHARTDALDARRSEDRLQDDAQPSRHAVSDARRSRPARAAAGCRNGSERKVYEAIRAACAGPAALRAARRAAVRQRRHPHRPRGQQDPQGHRRQEQDAGRASTRPTCRAGTATACRSRCRSRRRTARTSRSTETQRLCRAYATEQIERQKADFQRLGVLGDWDHPYTTMALRQRGRRDPHARQAPREGLSLSRPEAGELVLRLPVARWPRPKSNTRTAPTSRSTSAFALDDADRAKLAQAFGLRSAARRPGRARSSGRRRRGRFPRTRRSTCIRTSTMRWSRRRAGSWCWREDLVDACLARYGLRRHASSRTAQGRGARAHPLPPSVLRSRVAGLSRRLRDAGAGHRHRAQRRPRTASTTSSPAAATA